MPAPASSWAYVHLICGHVTTPEAITQTSTWKPKGTRKCFCDVCGKWVNRAPRPKPVEYPDEPMF